MEMEAFILAVIIGTLAAIVYSLRVLLVLERRVASMEMEAFILAVIIGTLAAIVYSLRVLLVLERRVASMEMHIKRVVDHTLKSKTTTKRKKR